MYLSSVHVWTTQAHIKDGEVEEDEEKLEADAQQALQLAHNGLGVPQRGRQVLPVVIDLHDIPSDGEFIPMDKFSKLRT